MADLPATRQLKIGLIGYGEVGKIIGKALRERQIAWVGTWDLLLREGDMAAHAIAAGIETCASLNDLLARADIVISAVTAGEDSAVADEAARTIRPGTFFLDFNSVSPGVKAHGSKVIDAAGGRYVEAGVMAPIAPYGVRVPMLLGGVHAGDLVGALTALGFDAKVVSDRIGVASAIKMCRSVVIKGMEALLVESFATARFYGVEDHVLASLRETYPQMDWNKEGSYFFERVTRHGKRRAEEMRESAQTVREAGVDPFMAAATAEKQDAVAALARQGAFKGLPADAPWRDYADRFNAAVNGAAVNGKDAKRKSA